MLKSHAPEGKRKYYCEKMREKIIAELKENPETKEFKCIHPKCKTPPMSRTDIMSHVKQCSVFEKQHYVDEIRAAREALRKIGAQIDEIPADEFLRVYNKNAGKYLPTPKENIDFFEFNSIITPDMPDDAEAATLIIPRTSEDNAIPPSKRVVGVLKSADGSTTYLNNGSDEFEEHRYIGLFPFGKGTFKEFRGTMTLPQYVKANITIADSRFRDRQAYILEMAMQIEESRAYFKTPKRFKKDFQNLGTHLLKRKTNFNGSQYLDYQREYVEFDAAVDDTKMYADINKNLNFLTEQLGRDPDLMITLTTSPRFEEIELLYNRYLHYNHFTDCGVDVACMSFDRMIKFSKQILFSDNDKLLFEPNDIIFMISSYY